MASPVTVIPNPGDENSHLLFFLNGFKQQLAMEVRSIVNTSQYTAFQDNGAPNGVIVNPSSLSAVLSNNVVSQPATCMRTHGASTALTTSKPTVYGITQPGVSDKNYYISTVSPIYNPIATGSGVQTTGSAVAACSDPATGNDYVYYIQVPQYVLTISCPSRRREH